MSLGKCNKIQYLMMLHKQLTQSRDLTKNITNITIKETSANTNTDLVKMSLGKIQQNTEIDDVPTSHFLKDIGKT